MLAIGSPFLCGSTERLIRGGGKSLGEIGTNSLGAGKSGSIAVKSEVSQVGKVDSIL